VSKTKLVDIWGGKKNFTILNYNAIALIMEAVNTSETSANFYETTWRSIPEDSHLVRPLIFFEKKVKRVGPQDHTLPRAQHCLKALLVTYILHDGNSSVYRTQLGRCLPLYLMTKKIHPSKRRDCKTF
jgi:hypothetical protein